MSESDDAYKVARRLIAEARESGATGLSLDGEDTRALTVLPSEIGTLDPLHSLNLTNTQISDLTPISSLTELLNLSLAKTQVSNLAPISSLTKLNIIWLTNTPVSDLAPISDLTTLLQLWLDNTKVSDLTPIGGLTGMQVLELNNTPVSNLAPISDFTDMRFLDVATTQVSDLAPISRFEKLRILWLHSTPVRDLTPLRHLTNLTRLVLDRVPAIDLRPLIALRRLADEPEDPGLTFANSGATLIDSRIAEIAAISDNGERARTLFDHLETWTPPSEAVTSPDPLLPVHVEEGRLEVAASLPTEAERDERLKRVLHERLRAKASDLARAAGNRFPRLAGRARAVALQADRPFEELDLLALHLDVEDLTSRRENGIEEGESFPPEVTEALDDVLRFAPGLTLGHPDVELLNERVAQFRADPPPTQEKATHDAMSRAVAGDEDAMGDRLRALEERVESLPEAIAIAVQRPTHRNILWRIATWGALGAAGVAWAVGQETVVAELSPHLRAFVVANWPIVIQVAGTYGTPFLTWFLASIAPVPELSVLANQMLTQIRVRRP